jgi:thiamine biosynthesis protein ThiS
MTERKDTISVHMNGKDRRVPTDLSVWALLEWLELNPALVVVELNREILDRDSYSGTEVREGDLLELVHFVGGG